MDLEYIQVGDYYLPAIVLSDADNRPIGRFGRLYRDYLMEHQSILYNQLLLSGKLHSLLVDLNEQAYARLDCIIEQMKYAEGVTEEMKQKNQLEWVQRMNGIRNRAEEIVLSELVYN